MAYGNITTLYEINLIPGTFLNSGDLIATDEGKTLSFWLWQLDSKCQLCHLLYDLSQVT